MSCTVYRRIYICDVHRVYDGRTRKAYYGRVRAAKRLTSLRLRVYAPTARTFFSLYTHTHTQDADAAGNDDDDRRVINRRIFRRRAGTAEGLVFLRSSSSSPARQ